MPSEEKLIIKPLSRPQKETVDDLVKWFCKAFDLEEELEPRILREIISKSLLGEGATSKELYQKMKIPRSTVIYHLNRFISAGLIVRRGRKYFLRSMSMEDTIAELQRDMLMEFSKLIEFAEKFDELITREIYGGRKKRKE
ncbi:MAG: winged helix-turn-helix domain-containing protein [Candidatus Micrarchaeia archaeon]|jgi:predicted transcriptional regulator